MNHSDKLRQLHKILSGHRYPVSNSTLQEKLGCTRATITRLISELRDRHAPLEYDRAAKGYHYTQKFDLELPGFWFDSNELLALLTIQRLLAEAGSGLLAGLLNSLQTRIEKILERDGVSAQHITQRVRILHMASRKLSAEHFQTVAGATIQRKCLVISYHGRGRDTETERQISPQRLIHYRDNWYLDAWCHQAQALRSFAIDRLRAAKMVEESAREFAYADLDAHFATSYGIFGGASLYTAVLRFSAERARWVSDEQWHPQQMGKFLGDGRYELHIPFANSHELIMDILKHGAEVEVMAPDVLRADVAAKLSKATEIYKPKLRAKI